MLLRNGYFCAVMAGLIWGLIGISTLNLSDLGMNTYEISFLRVLYAFILGMIYLHFSDKEKRTTFKAVPKNIWKYIILTGIVCQGLLNIFFSIAVIKTGTITGIMLMDVGPLFTMIMCRIFFKEHISFIKMLSLMMAFLGAVLLITNGELSQLNFNYTGVAFGLLGGACYGFYPIINKKASDSFDPVRLTIYSFGIATIFLMFFLNKNSWEIMFTSKAIIGGIFYGLVPTLIAYIFYSRSMIFISPSTASIISLLEVPATTIVGIFLLHEPVGIFKILGMIIVLSGMLLSKVKN
ncbi:MAG: DMT family transporter [Cetobacterium sp.]|uniref:DMT family transporter n=1 Tax=Cetobacterium sp. TaxID=2071632 RepID=UPI003F2AA019